MGIIVKWFMFL